MNISHRDLEAGRCVEVCHDDRLLGYAIFFAGGWDAYVVTPGMHLRRVLGNTESKNEAILMVKREAMA